MPDPILDRRQMLVIGAAASSAAAVSAMAATAPTPAFTAKPLPFDPKAVPGLSERLLVSHFENNYGNAVRKIGAITAEVAAMDVAAAPGYRLNGLKREELLAWNSVVLHELYFAGLGAAAAPSPALARALDRDFGSHEAWRTQFSAMGKALGGDSGWVILAWSRRDGRLVNQWAGDHTMSLADGAPLLALDMYEHAYAMDYGAKAAGYVDAFMKAMTWSEANRRFAREIAGA